MQISVDVGGTNIRVAGSPSLVDLGFADSIERSKITHNYQQEIEFIVQAARQCAKGGDIDALGICVPGTLNTDKTSLEFAQNLQWWEGKPFVAMLARELSCRVYAEHDGIAAGLGEAYYGAAPDEFCYLVWGTGIGGAEVRKGSDGHVRVEEIDWQTTFSVWESDCGGRALHDHYGSPSEELRSEQWLEVRQKFAAHLREFVVRTGARNIVFGGGLALRHKEFLEGIHIDQLDGIQVTGFGDEAGLYGGFAVARQAASA